MDQTAIKAGMTPIGANGTASPAKEPAVMPKSELKILAVKVLRALASLRITVTLFAMSMLLVFWGTLAQADTGIWTVVGTYFRGFLVWVPLKVILFNCVDNTALRIPFPGGLSIGAVMLVNLLAAHAVRFKLAWNRAGIILIHAGIIVMMLGELITHLYAVEGRMMIMTGHAANKVFNPRYSELAIVLPVDAKNDQVVVVPGALLQVGAKIHDERLPFDIEVLDYMVNSTIIDVKDKNPANKGIAVVMNEKAIALPETAGADTEQKEDVPAAYLRLWRGDKVLGTWLFSVFYSEVFYDYIQEVPVDGKNYQVSLRFKQTRRPYYVHLDKVTQKFYPGTDMAKDFRSYVRVQDPAVNQERKLEIYMNAPMYYGGETFYQAGVTTDRPGRAGNAIGTTLQVVRNPGWILPYASCAIVGFGLLIHFGYTLYRFLERRTVR
jgi:hypothetical protein